MKNTPLFYLRNKKCIDDHSHFHVMEWQKKRLLNRKLSLVCDACARQLQGKFINNDADPAVQDKCSVCNEICSVMHRTSWRLDEKGFYNKNIVNSSI